MGKEEHGENERRTKKKETDAGGFDKMKLPFQKKKRKRCKDSERVVGVSVIYKVTIR